MGDFRTPLIDLLRRKKDKADLGPMRYRIDGRGHAVPDEGTPSTMSELLRAVGPKGEPRPTGGGTIRDDKIAKALRDAGV